MESHSSSPCSQQTSTGPYPEPGQSSPHPPSYFSIIHLNIILTRTCMSSLKSLSFWIFNQNPICIILSSHVCYMPCPSHPPLLHHSNHIWRTVQVMMLLIIQFSPTSYDFVPLRSKYSTELSDLYYYIATTARAITTIIAATATTIIST
jgi:hypothetical protein